MCVICAAAKKRHMKRAEVQEAIRTNSAGFFGFTVHDGVRRTIRTLNDREFMKFFDEVVEDDDVWVMHARIPSRGEKSLDNVHGWEEDGIIFMHNMTLCSLDDMMKNAKWEGTDSEFFFRHVFIPFYRGCGPDAYKDGRFCDDLDNLVRHFCGMSNKFLFIMPDNRLVRYGTWVSEPDRKEGGECAFYASNASYRVYESRWAPPAKPKDPRVGYYGYGGYCGWNDGDWGDYDEETPAQVGGPPAKPAGPSAKTAGQDVSDLAKLVTKRLGRASLCKIALCDLVAHGVASYRAVDLDDATTEDDVEETMLGLLPGAFSDDTYDSAVQGLEEVGDNAAVSPPASPEDFADEYALNFAEELLRYGARGKNGIVPYFFREEHVDIAATTLMREWRVFAHVAGVSVDFTAKSAAAFACVADRPVRDGGRWSVKRVRPEDILVDRSLDADTAFRGISRILEFIQAEDGKGAGREERSLG